MKRKVFKFLPLAVIALPLLLISCGDDNNDEETTDTTPPVISITKPQPNQKIVPGVSTVVVEGTLTDDTELDECTLTIAYTGLNTQGVVLSGQNLKSSGMHAGIDDEPFAHDPVVLPLTGTEYLFPADYKPFGTMDAKVKYGEYTITVTVTDKAGNEAEKTVKIELGE